MITLEEQIEFLMGIVDDYERAEEIKSHSKWTQYIHHFKAILSTLEKVRDESKDAARLRFLKSAMSAPGAMQSFLRHNNWHPDTFSMGFEEAIDSAMERERKKPSTENPQ